jgi:hypothetical protein
MSLWTCPVCAYATDSLRDAADHVGRSAAPTPTRQVHFRERRNPVQESLSTVVGLNRRACGPAGPLPRPHRGQWHNSPVIRLADRSAPGDAAAVQCYVIRNSTGAPKFVPRTVTVASQIETVTLQVVRPFRLCVPADKNGEDPSAPSHPDELLCYKTQSGHFGDEKHTIDNQFGQRDVTIISRNELCVPSSANVVTTTTSSTTSTTAVSTTSTSSTTSSSTSTTGPVTTST